jgi:hypothetical protein
MPRPIGKKFDPEEVVARYESGQPVEGAGLTVRPVAGRPGASASLT